jgi:cytochrome P450
LNDPRAVHELLNQKGALFSDRPVDEQWELLTNNEAFVVMHSGHIWRASRKIASQILSSKHLDGKLAEVLEAE